MLKLKEKYESKNVNAIELKLTHITSKSLEVPRSMLSPSKRSEAKLPSSTSQKKS